MKLIDRVCWEPAGWRAFPDSLKIAETASPMHQQQGSTFKLDKLENGVEAMVPQFVQTGDVVHLDLQTMKYMDRVKTDAKGNHA